MIYFTSQKLNTYPNCSFKGKDLQEDICDDCMPTDNSMLLETYLKTSGENNIVFLSSANKPQITNSTEIENIKNFRKLKNNSARGETLSSKRNRKYLHLIKKSGIDTIIDLRDKYKSSKYPELCKKYGFNYYNIPIDSYSIDDKTIIEELPTFFNLINRGNYYISCAQGLHRTDIALSINYIFNPKENFPPVLEGHTRDNKLITDDITRRLNSIKNKISKEELKNLGWGEDFNDEFEKRKKSLKNYNEVLIKVL